MTSAEARMTPAMKGLQTRMEAAFLESAPEKKRCTGPCGKMLPFRMFGTRTKHALREDGTLRPTKVLAQSRCVACRRHRPNVAQDTQPLVRRRVISPA